MRNFFIKKKHFWKNFFRFYLQKPYKKPWFYQKTNHFHARRFFKTQKLFKTFLTKKCSRKNFFDKNIVNKFIFDNILGKTV